MNQDNAINDDDHYTSLTDFRPRVRFEDQQTLESFLHPLEDATTMTTTIATPIQKSLYIESDNEEDDEEEEVIFESIEAPVIHLHSSRKTNNENVGRNTVSLLDDENDNSTKWNIPGNAGFLELEQPNFRQSSSSSTSPIQTASGLLLTHRRTNPSSTSFIHNNKPSSSSWNISSSSSPSKQQRQNQWKQSTTTLESNYMMPPAVYGHRMLRYVRAWVGVSACLFLFGTMVLLHHGLSSSTPQSVSLQPNDTKEDAGSSSTTTVHLLPLPESIDVADRVVLLPLPEHEPEQNQQHQRRRRLQQPLESIILPDEPIPEHRESLTLPHTANQNHKYHNKNAQNHHFHKPNQHQNHRHGLQDLIFPHNHHDQHHRRGVHELLNEFHDWMATHKKRYHSEQEKHHRFRIWADNRERTRIKNERHGPCQMTGKLVFGHNAFSDMTPEEFQSQHLTGYHLSREPIRRGVDPHGGLPVLGPHVKIPQYHAWLHERLLLHDISLSPISARYMSCKWWDVSCYLRSIFSKYLYGLGGTMEPAYDANSYPTSIDWRKLGAVTDVHAQGNCGACWAITAVETVESAVFIGTGELHDLAETEVIVCQRSCEMCAGGWPQDAFEYVMSNKGLPLEKNMQYNGDWLLLISEAVGDNSDELNEDTVKSYIAETCPANSGNKNNKNNDKNNEHKSGSADHGGGGKAYADVQGTNTYARYGKIEGYGYSTEKCVCYTDGTGCDCDHQNEGYAVRNLATYGPAVVCLDASTWQDYTSGIITKESGCSSGFMDVNHCVQAVGYAYFSEEDAEKQEGSRDKDGGKSGSGDKNGSKDSNRVGYWIVRNQWSAYWGMNGYAYVAMGDNTCGILNDMIQAYT